MANNVPPRKPAEASGVMVLVHPPERRRRRSTVPALAGDCACCCCTCCCLHSLGAIIGAAVAPNLGGDSKPRAPSDEPRITLPVSGPSAVSLFWWTLLVFVVGAMVLLSIKYDNPLGGMFLILLILPGLQLGAAVLIAFVLALSARPDRSYQFRKLGKIVKGSLIGALLGILGMAAILGILILVR